MDDDLVVPIHMEHKALLAEVWQFKDQHVGTQTQHLPHFAKLSLPVDPILRHDAVLLESKSGQRLGAQNGRR